MIAPGDRNVRTIFGDAGAATLIRGVDSPTGGDLIGPFIFGTDGRGGPNLIVKDGGLRSMDAATRTWTKPATLEMNGPEIFNFTLRVVPESMRALLAKANISAEAVDWFVPHQANRYMLDHLRDKMGLPKEKFFVGMRECGNTVSASIPVALADAARRGLLRPNALLALAGFGVGYSWAACLARWQG